MITILQNSESKLAEDMKHPLTDDDFNRGKNIQSNKFSIDDDVLYGGKLFEGDIADNLLITAGTVSNLTIITGQK